jgi:cysteine desulfurase / selenocysteine lyase
MIYLDNGATTFPKPPCMLAAMKECIRGYCGNPGRSGHSFSTRTAQGIYESRKEIAELFCIEDPATIIFTSNATEALNLGIKGVLRAGDHAITTAMEHNSVLRPLKALEEKGVETTILKCNTEGYIEPENIKKSIKGNTRLVICTHASNVTGTIMPIGEIAKIAKNAGILFMLDASQSGGCRRIDLADMGIDLLAVPGHKGLLGPQGTGFLYAKKGTELMPLKEGGTGTDSKSTLQPLEFPDGYEAGTLNAPAIIGLGASVKWIKRVGIENIQRHEEALVSLLDENLRNIEGITVYGPKKASEKSAIVAFNIKGIDCEEVADVLYKRYDIGVRSGFHCAGLAHKTIGTWETGAVRISVGPFNTKREIVAVSSALLRITKVKHYKA